MASRSANMASPREPRLRTVVKPAISVRFAYIAARNEACTLLLVSHSGMVETPRLQAKPLGGLRYDPRMKGYRKSSHTTYQLNYHFVFIPKYRKPVLRGDVALRLRELIKRDLCDAPHRNTEGPCTARARSSVAERAATAVAEPSNAGDQGEDIAQADA